MTSYSLRDDRFRSRSFLYKHLQTLAAYEYMLGWVVCVTYVILYVSFFRVMVVDS